MMKGPGLSFIFILIFMSCSSNGMEEYVGHIDTSNLQSSMRKLTLHYKLYNEHKSEIIDDKLAVSIFNRYRVPSQQQARYLLIYINKAVYQKMDMSAFIEDNQFFIDLQDYGNELPTFSISTQVQIINTVEDDKVIQWKPMENIDYVRIDLYRDTSEFPGFLLFVPKNYDYVSNKMLEDAVKIDNNENTIILKNEVCFIQSTLEENSSMFYMDCYSATAFRFNSKGNGDTQLTLPTKRYPLQIKD